MFTGDNKHAMGKSYYRLIGVIDNKKFHSHCADSVEWAARKTIHTLLYGSSCFWEKTSQILATCVLRMLYVYRTWRSSLSKHICYIPQYQRENDLI